MKKIMAMMMAMFVVAGLSGCGSVSANPSTATASQQSDAAGSQSEVGDGGEEKASDESEMGAFADPSTDKGGTNWKVQKIPVNEEWVTEKDYSNDKDAWETRILNLYWFSHADQDRMGGNYVTVEVEAKSINGGAFGGNRYRLYQNDYKLETVVVPETKELLRKLIEPFDLDYTETDTAVRAGATKKYLFDYALESLEADEPVDIERSGDCTQHRNQVIELTPDSMSNESKRKYRDIDGKAFTADGLQFRVTGIYSDANYVIFRVNIDNPKDDTLAVGSEYAPTMYQDDAALESEGCREILTQKELQASMVGARVQPRGTREIAYCGVISNEHPVDLVFKDWDGDTVYEETFNLIE